MREARINGKLVIAEPGAPDSAPCPDCNIEVPARRCTRLANPSGTSTGTSADKEWTAPDDIDRPDRP